MMMIVYAGIVDIMQYVLYLSTYTYICLFQCTHTVGVRRVFTLTYRDLKWGKRLPAAGSLIQVRTERVMIIIS